ncbi:MAG: hypothetical protein P4L36_10995 [Holophaga sp.]|nr:hypothetical protein [Holophaga sp.]
MLPFRGLGFLLCGLCLAGQVLQGEPLLDFMYTKFAASFTRGSGPGTEFLVLAVPGVPLVPADLKNPAYISTMLDQVPLPSRSYRPSGYLYSSVYGKVLTRAAVTRYQVAADRNLALKAKRMMFDRSRPGQVTRDYAAYLKYEAEYAAALDARTIAQAESRGTRKPVSPSLDQAVQTARKTWEQRGSKVKIDNALKALRKTYDSNAPVLFEELRSAFENAQEPSGEDGEPWLPVLANPPVEEWLSPKGWHPWAFHQSDCRPGAPGAAGPLPPGRIQGDGPVPADWTPSMTLTVEVKRVNILRPWMDTAIFSVHTWRMLDSAGFSVVSTGNPADPDPGPMPILITGILLARRLTLTGAGPSAKGTQKRPARLGPFSLAGAKPPSGGGTVITVPDPQIIAFFCQIVPKSPTPNPKFFR